MAVQIPRANPSQVNFRRWLGSLNFVLCGGPGYVGEENRFQALLEHWGEVEACVPFLASWWRSGGHHELCVRSGDPVWCFVARLIGHRLDRRVVLGSPRVAVLCAYVFFDGRWRDCEGVLGGDLLACYLYARVSGGRLPAHLHNRLVLEGVGGVVLDRYLRDFG